MKAIITRQNPNGSYDQVGMKNRFLTSHYKTEKNLLRYGLPDNFRGRIKIEFFSDNIYTAPYKTMFLAYGQTIYQSI